MSPACRLARVGGCRLRTLSRRTASTTFRSGSRAIGTGTSVGSGTAVHTLQLLLDRRPVATFTIEPPEGGDDTLTDSQLIARVPVTAGSHELAATFLKDASSLIETERQPLQAHFNKNRHPRLTPAIHQVSVTGPYAPQGASDTPSRRRLFVCTPGQAGEVAAEEVCAEEILSKLMRRAYRRPISDAEVAGPMAFYKEARSDGDIDAGIGSALTSVLVNPAFLFRVEVDPEQVSGGAYRISDLELASRLSFFLWSSIPDDELLDAAERGELSGPGGARAAGARGCSPIRDRRALVEQLRWPVAPSAQPRNRSRPDCGCFPTSTTTCARRSGEKPSCSSKACCAKTAACSICSTRTTRS